MLVKADPTAPALLDLPINPVPPGGRTLMVAGRWNVPLRVALWPATGEARGTVVIVQGYHCAGQYALPATHDGFDISTIFRTAPAPPGADRVRPGR